MKVKIRIYKKKFFTLSLFEKNTKVKLRESFYSLKIVLLFLLFYDNENKLSYKYR